MARQDNANTIISDVALEVGLTPVTDAYSTNREEYLQLQGLLNIAGQELLELHDWTILQDLFPLNTGINPPPDGLYDLPDDFSRMIDQTGWNRDANLPLGGPLSPQTWSTLVGRDLASTTLYASFRLTQNQIQLYPSPAPPETQLQFMYISRNWVEETGGAQKDRATNGTDIVLYDPILIKKLLKVKWLSAKGFDTSLASREFDLMFKSRTGSDSGAPILNASGVAAYPYLNPWRNMSDTGYGGV